MMPARFQTRVLELDLSVNPGLAPSSYVVVDKALNFPEPLLPHLLNGTSLYLPPRAAESISWCCVQKALSSTPAERE